MRENCQDLNCLAGIRVVDFTQFEAGTSCTEAGEIDDLQREGTLSALCCELRLQLLHPPEP